MNATTPTRSTIVPIPDEDALPWRGFDSASLRLAAGAPTAALSAYISCSIYPFHLKVPQKKTD